MRKEVDFLLENDLAEPSLSPWASPCLLTPKPDGSSRFCTDYRRVNRDTVPDSYPLPLMEDLIDGAKSILAFITPFGLYHSRVLPFGLANAPATFQRIMNYITQAYLDNQVVVSDVWEEHLGRQ